MFCKTQFPALSLGILDVCKIITPIGPIPIPLPNFAFSTLAIPNITNHFISAMPAHNLLTQTMLSNGNEVSIPLGGIVSNQFMGKKMNCLGSFRTFFQCMPSTRFLDMSLQNGFISNVPGINLSPSQVKVMVLS